MTDADGHRVLAEAEARARDPRWRARVRAATDWLEATPDVQQGPPEMSYSDPDRMTDLEREEWERTVDDAVQAVDAASRERRPDFHDPHRAGKVELGGGIQEHSERLRRSLGIDVGGEPRTTEVRVAPSSPAEVGGKA